MRTLGIDLASQPSKTAACVIDWNASPPTVVTLTVGLDDKEILELAGQLEVGTPGKVGSNALAIDAPFGWPQPFAEFVDRVNSGSGTRLDWNPVERKRLTFRLTDLYVQQRLGVWPLAVAADKIALPAIRCAGLLDALGVRDRSGVNGVFEVYPAAALKAWGFPHKSYKSEKASPALQALVRKVSEACSWPTILNADYALCTRDHDAFDAVIAAIVARAAALRMTERPEGQRVLDADAHVVPPDTVLDRARSEGWIALPKQDCRVRDLFDMEQGSLSIDALAAQGT